MSRRALLIVGFYLLATVAFTWPLVLHPFSLLAADNPSGDPSLNLWVLGWNLQTLAAHPHWWITGRVFDAPIYFPAPNTLAYADHLLLQTLAVSPFYAITGSLAFTYNALLLASLAASGLAMHALARSLTGSHAAALVAGLIYGFAPYHFTHLTHIQLQALYFLPLSFFFLHRMLAADRGADTIGLGVTLGLQVVSTVYYGVIGGIGAAVVAIVLVTLSGRTLDWRLARRGLAAAGIALMVMLPWSYPYLLVRRDAAGGRTLGEASRGSAVLASYVQAPPANALYGRTGWLRPGPDSRLPRREGAEQDLFPGFCALVLAVAGAVGAPRGLRRIAAAYGILAVAGVVLSLGPDGVRPLYAVLYDWLFGMAAIRAPARFSVLVLCAIAVLAAFAIRALEHRRPRTGPLAALVVLAIGVEYANRAAFSPPPALATEAGAFLRNQPGSGAVICVPLVMFDGNTPCMLQSLEHGRPVVNGYSGLRPPFFEALVDQMSRLPSPESLVALHDLGVEFIVSDSALAVDGGTETPLVERARFAGQLVYQMAWSPGIEAKLREASAPPPPDPGPVPFAVGESATYTVRWTSGPVGIPAGEATIAVVPPPEAATFRFAVTAKTASWVSRFYEVDAAIEATADARLLPLAYREAIDEGGRRIDRRLAFDGSRREVRVDSGGTSITLPIDAGARDPISALFYIRTLSLAPGSRFSLPISDNGRRMRLDVLVHDIEPIDVDGRARRAWRVEARLIDRLDRRTPAITAWVSADDRRLPVLVDVSAGFGSVRVELARAGR